MRVADLDTEEQSLHLELNRHQIIVLMFSLSSHITILIRAIFNCVTLHSCICGMKPFENKSILGRVLILHCLLALAITSLYVTALLWFLPNISEAFVLHFGWRCSCLCGPVYDKVWFCSLNPWHKPPQTKSFFLLYT